MENITWEPEENFSQLDELRPFAFRDFALYPMFETSQASYHSESCNSILCSQSGIALIDFKNKHSRYAILHRTSEKLFAVGYHNIFDYYSVSFHSYENAQKFISYLIKCKDLIMAPDYIFRRSMDSNNILHKDINSENFNT